MRGLYAIVDPEACRPPFADPVQLAEEILAGGCAVMQLRSKQLDDLQYAALAVPMIASCHRAGVPFIVNDRVHLVKSLGADGVHLGQTDMPPMLARELVGLRFVGVSTHNAAQAAKAIEQGADWVALGPIYQTKSKVNAEPAVGMPALRTLCSSITTPVIAIGGLDLRSARHAVDAGASMVAAISTLANSLDPRARVAELQGLFHAV